MKTLENSKQPSVAAKELDSSCDGNSLDYESQGLVSRLWGSALSFQVRFEELSETVRGEAASPSSRCSGVRPREPEAECQSTLGGEVRSLGHH